jgi:hypothetical protein
MSYNHWVKNTKRRQEGCDMNVEFPETLRRCFHEQHGDGVVMYSRCDNPHWIRVFFFELGGIWVNLSDLTLKSGTMSKDEADERARKFMRTSNYTDPVYHKVEEFIPQADDELIRYHEAAELIDRRSATIGTAAWSGRLIKVMKGHIPYVYKRQVLVARWGTPRKPIPARTL